MRPLQGHIISSPPGTHFKNTLFSYCELSKAIINSSSVLKRERKEVGKEGERVRGREGEKVTSFLYNEHTMHVFLFFACLPLSPTKNYIKLRKNNEKPHKKRKNPLFLGVLSVFSSSRKGRQYT